MALRIRAAVASAPCLARQRRAGWGVPGMQNLKNFFGKSETDKMRDFVAKRDGQTAPRPKGFGAPKRRDEEAVAREASGPQRTLNAALQRLEEVVGQLEGDEHIAAGTVAANLEMYLRYVEAYAEGREVGHEDEEALPAPSATAAVTPRVAAALKHSSDLLTGVREFVDSPSDAELVRSMTKFAVLAGDEKAYETALRCALVGLKVAETATPFPDDGTVEEGDASPLSVMPSVCRYENCLGRQGSVIERCEALLPIATKSPSADGTPDLYLQYAHALYTVGRYADAVAAARSLESLNVPFKQRNAAESLKQAALEGQRAGRHPLLHLPDGAPVYVSVSALFRKVAFLQKFHSYRSAAETVQLLTKLHAVYSETSEARPLRFFLDEGFPRDGLDAQAFVSTAVSVDDQMVEEFRKLVDEDGVEHAAVCGSQRSVSHMNHVLQSSGLTSGVTLVDPERLWDFCFAELVSDVANGFPPKKATPEPWAPPRLGVTI